MPERSADWLAQAERDLEMTRHALEGGFYEWACFVAQQAAEKAVKGLYQYLHGEAWGHSVTDLLKALPQEHQPPAELVERARVLDQYYIPPRYPNAFASGAPKEYYTREVAEDALAHANALLGFCQSKVP